MELPRNKLTSLRNAFGCESAEGILIMPQPGGTLQRTANPPRGLSAAELGRSAESKSGEK